MTILQRVLLLACSALVGLAFASAASAVYAPRLLVQGTSHALGAGGPVAFAVRQAEADDPTAKITIYSPLGYQVDLNATPGTIIGTARATVKVGALGGARVPVTGNVTAEDPGRFVNHPCRGAGRSQAVWALTVTLAGTPVTVPIFVDPVRTAPEADFASAKIQVCFNSPNDPARNPTGSQLLEASFTSNVFTNPDTAGNNYRWIAVFTPYRAGVPAVNPAGTVQVDTIVKLPVQLALAAKKQRRGGRSFAVLSGSLREGTQLLPRTAVAILWSTRSAKGTTRVLKTVRTNRRGGFSLRVAIKRRTWFRARVVLPARRASTPCSPALAPACSSVWLAPVGTSQRPLFSRQTVSVRP